MMTIDKTICPDCRHPVNCHHDGTGVWGRGCNQPLAMELQCPCQNTYATFNALNALAAELKELRELVGAMDKVTATDWYGQWAYLVTGDKYRIYDNADNLLATGTDPFDAWRKMNAGEDE